MDIAVTVEHIDAAIIIKQQTRIMMESAKYGSFPTSVLNVVRPVNVESVHIIARETYVVHSFVVAQTGSP
ncbi:hypothetical protein D3C73_1189930 [compost metagenome]